MTTVKIGAMFVDCLHDATSDEVKPKQRGDLFTKSKARLAFFLLYSFRLDHPNVVKLLEAYESKSYVYLVMEL